MKKRGLSAVITTLIIILLVLVAVGVVWVVIANLINQGTEEINLGKFTLNMEIKDVNVKGDGTVDVKVKRNAGKGDLTGIKFLINDGVEVYEFEKETDIGELGQRTFNLNYNGAVKEISIAPIFTLESGKESLGNEIDFEDLTGKSCLDLLKKGFSVDRVYYIDVDGSGGEDGLQVYCDMTTDGGGWTLIGKTVLSGLTSDERDAIRLGTWEDYTEDGYGSPETSSRIYWMPLKYWNILTEEYPSNQFRSETTAAEVRVMNLVVADSSDKYRFDWDSVVPGYTELYISHFKGMQFTTHDQDNDLYSSNCAVDNGGYNGGWWYRSCGQLSMLHHSGNLYSLENNVAIPVNYNYLYFR